MEGPEEGGVDVVVYTAEIREPYMGNSVPVSVHIYRRGGRIVHVQIENPERIKVVAKKGREYAMSYKTFHHETTGMP